MLWLERISFLVAARVAVVVAVYFIEARSLNELFISSLFVICKGLLFRVRLFQIIITLLTFIVLSQQLDCIIVLVKIITPYISTPLLIYFTQPLSANLINSTIIL